MPLYFPDQINLLTRNVENDKKTITIPKSSMHRFWMKTCEGEKNISVTHYNLSCAFDTMSRQIVSNY